MRKNINLFSLLVGITLMSHNGHSQVANSLSGDTSSRIQSIMTVTPSQGVAPLRVNVFASNSIGRNLKFNIQTGDGGTINTPRASYLYNDTGVYNLSLTITDDRGEISTASHKIFVRSAGDGVLSFPSWEGVPLEQNYGDKYYYSFVWTILERNAKRVMLTGPTQDGDVENMDKFFCAIRDYDNKIWVNNGPNDWRATTIPIDKFRYQVTFKMDFINKTYTVWVDGELVGKGLALSGDGDSFGGYGMYSERENQFLITNVNVDQTAIGIIPEKVVIYQKKALWIGNGWHVPRAKPGQEWSVMGWNGKRMYGGLLDGSGFFIPAWGGCTVPNGCFVVME